ncbi:hypothetical protein GE09DRAFT_1214855 [Coniochaeta sp. 2T2.1]|nr:hypothetical protein GE09DRAFT_1214855 [Coniochaeta sp. 2T2.1]
MSKRRPISKFNYFAVSTPVAGFRMCKPSYHAARADAPLGYIAMSALVMDSRMESSPRLLLLQRAAGDVDANKWEPPGGAFDDDDNTILHAAARELWEEAGLEVGRFRGLVGDPYFFSA